MQRPRVWLNSRSRPRKFGLTMFQAFACNKVCEILIQRSSISSRNVPRIPRSRAEKMAAAHAFLITPSESRVTTFSWRKLKRPWKLSGHANFLVNLASATFLKTLRVNGLRVSYVKRKLRSFRLPTRKSALTLASKPSQQRAMVKNLVNPNAFAACAKNLLASNDCIHFL